MGNENYHEGHRERLKNQFFIAGERGMPDHLLLEILLMYAIPRKDVNELAHRLIHRFGSLEGVFSASREDLLMVDGIGKSTATMLLSIGAMYDRAACDRHFPLQSKRVTTPKQISAYAIRLCKKEHLENAYIICVNAKMEIIASEMIGMGNIAGVDFQPRRIFETAVAYHADGIFLVHNHPSGYVVPSKEDEMLAEQLTALGADLDVRVLDNLVVGHQAVCSLVSRNVFLFSQHDLSETITLEEYKKRVEQHLDNVDLKLS